MPLGDDRTHLRAANRKAGLRKRSAGRAARDELIIPVHLKNVNMHKAGAVPSFFQFMREDCVAAEGASALRI
jgi:hypothetical protein